jgi:Acetyl-CoA acetyltransferase
MHAVYQREDLTDLRALKMAFERAKKMAKISIKDIDLMELHDAFTILEICEIENLGLFKREEIAKAYKDGIFEIDGEIPVNTSGGLKARGHPVGGTGIYQIYEIVEQLRGKAARRQVEDAKTGLCVNFGGFGDNVIVSILKRS